MSETIILDNQYITIKFLPEKKMIYHTVHQPISGQDLRDALTTGFDALKSYGVSKWLSDERKNGPMSDEDRASLGIDGLAVGELPSATLRKRRQRALDRLRVAWRKLYGEP